MPKIAKVSGKGQITRPHWVDIEPVNDVATKDRRLYRELQNIANLPKRDRQEALLRTFDVFLPKAP